MSETMMKAKHSPTPFRRGGKDGQIVYDANGMPVANCIVFHSKADERLMEANAEFIVQACNALTAASARRGE